MLDVTNTCERDIDINFLLLFRLLFLIVVIVLLLFGLDFFHCCFTVTFALVIPYKFARHLAGGRK